MKILIDLPRAKHGDSSEVNLPLHYVQTNFINSKIIKNVFKHSEPERYSDVNNIHQIDCHCRACALLSSLTYSHKHQIVNIITQPENVLSTTKKNYLKFFEWIRPNSKFWWIILFDLSLLDTALQTLFFPFSIILDCQPVFLVR